MRTCLPITSISLVAISVWNEGASAETSQLYFPAADGWTWDNDTWLSFDVERWKKGVPLNQIVHSISSRFYLRFTSDYLIMSWNLL